MQIKDIIQNINDKKILIKIKEIIKNPLFQRPACIIGVLFFIISINKNINSDNIQGESINLERANTGIMNLHMLSNHFNQTIDVSYDNKSNPKYPIINNIGKEIEGITFENNQTASLEDHTDIKLIPSDDVKNVENIAHFEHSNLTVDDKLNIILEREKLTFQQFIEIVCTVFGEAGESYEECYNVISTINNRRLSYRYTSFVNYIFNNDIGYNLYSQVICPGQFTAYNGNLYNYYIELPFDEIKQIPGYQAIIDCLYTLESNHHYLSFKSAKSNPSGKKQFTEGGNRYHDELTQEDTIPENERKNCPYENKSTILSK